jgi:hypothetical protein
MNEQSGTAGLLRKKLLQRVRQYNNVLVDINEYLTSQVWYFFFSEKKNFVSHLLLIDMQQLPKPHLGSFYKPKLNSCVYLLEMYDDNL